MSAETVALIVGLLPTLTALAGVAWRERNLRTAAEHLCTTQAEKLAAYEREVGPLTYEVKLTERDVSRRSALPRRPQSSESEAAGWPYIAVNPRERRRRRRS